MYDSTNTDQTNTDQITFNSLDDILNSPLFDFLIEDDNNMTPDEIKLGIEFGQGMVKVLKKRNIDY